MKLSSNHKLLGLIILAVSLRLFLSWSTFHPDWRAFHLGGTIIASGHWLDLYDYLGQVFRADLPLQVFPVDLFIYPPAIYWLHGLWHGLWSNVFQLKFLDQVMIGQFGHIELNWQLLITKLVYLPFDLLGGWWLSQLFSTPRQRWWAWVLWLFNPLTIYATYMMGQFDLIATVMVIWSLLLYKQQKVFGSAVALGIGIAFKLYPLFLLPILIINTKGYSRKLIVGILGLLPYIVTTLPYLMSEGFRNSALVAGQTLKSFYATIPVSGNQSIILYPTVLVIIYLAIAYYRHKSALWSQYLLVLINFYIFTHSHPQWLIWIWPFIVLETLSLNSYRLLPYLIIVGVFVSQLFFFDPTLTTGLFAPLYPTLDNADSIWQILGIKLDLNLARSILHSIWVGFGLWLIYKYWPGRTTSENHS